MTCYGDRRAYDFYEEEDPYSTPRAGSVDCVDAVLPWRFEEEPLPPPVPPKSDLKEAREARSAVASIPKRVTPWLFRHVKKPVTRATQTAPAPESAPAPQKAYPTDIRGSPKPEPPAYHAVPQQQIHPSGSGERSATTTSRGPTAAVVQSHQSTVQVQPRTPPKPDVAHRSARGRGGGETQRAPPTSHSGCPQLRSVRSAPHEERSRRPGTRAPPPPPLRPAAAVRPERTHLVLPSYHSAQPFPSPAPPPPPYRASAEDNSSPTSVRSRSLPRSSRNKHGGRTFEKEAAPLPPLPLPPPLPSHPQLSNSAISRIQAGRKVSKEFGDAIMQQELRWATPTSDHHSGLDPVPVPNPRLGRRFLSASELQSHRKARLRTDKINPEHEARQRTLNKSSNIGRCSGDSRQRAVSAHPGRGQDKGSQRARR